VRIALGIQYNGSRYHGWQFQPELITVQGTLQAALAKITTHDVSLLCAGRTDTGVHATAQVVHFDSPVKRDLRAWVFGTNSYLPRDISVQWAKVVPESFHARFSAIARRYRYFIYNYPARPAALPGQLTWYYMQLDEACMQKAAQHLVGEHDFSAYRAAECQAKQPVRCIEYINIQRHDNVICVDIKANGFLHHMVRNIVGVLLAIGTGKEPVDWSLEILKSCDRRLGGITAPAHGLYFVEAVYPPEFALPTTQEFNLYL
jgi:tRNA pseudouridine38-40 synthase